MMSWWYRRFYVWINPRALFVSAYTFDNHGTKVEIIDVISSVILFFITGSNIEVSPHRLCVVPYIWTGKCWPCNTYFLVEQASVNLVIHSNQEYIKEIYFGSKVSITTIIISKKILWNVRFSFEQLIIEKISRILAEIHETCWKYLIEIVPNSKSFDIRKMKVFMNLSISKR